MRKKYSAENSGEKNFEKKNFEKFFPLKNPLGASGENMNVCHSYSYFQNTAARLDAARPCALRALTSI